MALSSIGGTSTGSGSVLGISTVNPQISVQEPISTGNGNYYHQHTDLSFASRGIGIAFTRTYNSLDSYAGPLGANWTHSYNIFLASTSSGVIVKWSDGHGENFTWTGSAFVPQVGIHSTLVRNGDGFFTLTTKFGVKYLFDGFGKLASITDRNGNSITFTYDLAGNLAQITDPIGRSLTLSNDISNRIQQITDPLGRKVTFAYDSNDNLVNATDAAGGATQYLYDPNHRITQIILPNGASLLQNSYDAHGRVAAQINGRGFTWTFAYGTPASGQTTITDARGNKTVHIYDSSLRIISIADAAGGMTSFGYDAQNNRTSVTDANGNSSQFTYDTAGNLLNVTDALGHTRQFTYDSTNNLLSASTPLGNTTTSVYDAHGNLTSMADPLGNVSRFAYDVFGEVISRTDTNGNTTTLNYDGNGNLVKSTDPLGNINTMVYDGDSRLVSTTDANGHTSSIFFDNLDRITKTIIDCPFIISFDCTLQEAAKNRIVTSAIIHFAIVDR